MATRINPALKHLKQQQFLLQILVLGFIMAFFWIFISLFKSQQTTVIDPVLKELAIPLNPNLDESVIRRLEQKNPTQPLLDTAPSVVRNRPTTPIVITSSTSSASPLPQPSSLLPPTPTPTPATTASPLIPPPSATSATGLLN